MSFRKVLAVVFLGLGLGAAAHAQLGVYGEYGVQQYGGVQCLATAPITCSNGAPGVSASGSKSTGSISPTGGLGGVYYDFKTYGPVRLGVDFRAGNNHANKSASGSGGGDALTTGNFFLGGVRGSFHTRYSWLKPYAQVSVGYARSNLTEPSCATSSGGILLCGGAVTNPNPRYDDNFLQIEGFVGADIKIFPVMDFRAIELGYGNMNRLGSGSSFDEASSVSVKSLGAGVVFHLP
jgi:hypothetical protein